MQQVCELVLIPSFSFTSDLCASKCLSHLTSYFPVSLSAEQFTGHFCKQLRGILVRNVMGSYPTDATKKGGGVSWYEHRDYCPFLCEYPDQ